MVSPDSQGPWDPQPDPPYSPPPPPPIQGSRYREVPIPLPHLLLLGFPLPKMFSPLIHPSALTCHQVSACLSLSLAQGLQPSFSLE